MIQKIGTSFLFKIPLELHNKVKNLSAERSVNMADIVRTAVKEYVDREENDGQQKTEVV